MIGKVLIPRGEKDEGWSMLPRWLKRSLAVFTPEPLNYDRESARRKRQIDKGTLKAENRGV